jgi:sterol desaturase/sphingolipid hydroxylase (fatty acid hydroxylase superfamily)
VIRTLRFGFSSTVTALGMAPLYSHAHDRFLPWFVQWWFGDGAVAAAGGALIGNFALATTPLSGSLSWVQPVDVFFGLALSFAISVVYVAVHGIYLHLDRMQDPPSSFKLHRARWMEPGESLIKVTLVQQAVAHVISAPLVMVLVAGPGLRAMNRGSDISSPGTLPAAPVLFCHLVVCFLLNECMFFWGHRALHSPLLYRRVHKVHHQYVGTRSFAAEHSHPLEQVLTGHVPFLVGLFACRAHFHTTCVWFFCRLIQTYEGHSGYFLRGVASVSVPVPARVAAVVGCGPSLTVDLFESLGITSPHQSAFHDFHHTRNTGCDGVCACMSDVGLCVCLCATCITMQITYNPIRIAMQVISGGPSWTICSGPWTCGCMRAGWRDTWLLVTARR